MNGAELKQIFKEQELTPEKVAEKTGYSAAYIRNILYGSDSLNDRMKWRLVQAFPVLIDALSPDNGNDPS
jgi:transcriptional regulator with XRE-family HTH domain